MSATSPQVLARLTTVEARIQLRDPSSVVFGIALPGLLLTVLGLAMPWADEPLDPDDPALAGVTAITSYAPTVLALAIATIAFTTFPTVFATYREKGVLRRLSTTPLPSSRVLMAQLLVAAGLLVTAAVLAVVLGVVVLGIRLPTQPLVVVLAFVVGAAASISAGCLVAARAPTVGVATGVGMIVYTASMFFAGVWMPLALMPEAVQAISAWTPVGAASQAMATGWYGTGVPTSELLVMTGWTLVCVPVAARIFRWS